MFSNKLKLNQDKTEFMILGLKSQTKKVTRTSLSLSNEVIESSDKVRNLGVIMDSQLNLNEHVRHLSKICYAQISSIWKIRKFLTEEATKQLIHATVISKLDYCNLLMIGITDNQITKLQRIQNSAARLIFRTSKYDHVTPLLKKLHWLPVKYRIKFKLVVTVFKGLNGLAPQYVSDMLHTSGRSRPKFES